MKNKHFFHHFTEYLLYNEPDSRSDTFVYETCLYALNENEAVRDPEVIKHDFGFWHFFSFTFYLSFNRINTAIHL